ncbi:FAD-binding oxidoreductase [Ammoniphilus sp. 3BR4]|uniref:FAD-binding oxidoreductase n=1 Tax=Ammoniphilus sp. 3BR4 TaxID=3158265 RepID=UPI0034674104
MLLASFDSLLLREGIPSVPGELHPLGNSGALIAYPQSEEQIAAILRYAHDQGLKVIPTGRGTKRGFGGIEEKADLLLSLAEYRGIVEYSEGDLTMTVKAGTTMKEIQQFLSENRQMLPLDPAWPEDATIGGVIAANDSGPKRCRYGSARDLVIGMRIVYPDGKILRTGGKVVKNVAGYDMNKLFIGSMGTLAVMSEVTLKLRPKPKCERLVLLSFPESMLSSIPSFVTALLDSTNEPVSIEMLNPALHNHCNGEEGFGLAITFADMEKAVLCQIEWIKNRVPQGTRIRVLSEEDTVKWWEMFSRISPNGTQAELQPVLGLKLGSKNRDVFEIVSFCDELGRKRQLVVFCHGGAGHGISRVFIRGHEEELVQCTEEIRRFAQLKGGYAVVQHASLALRQQVEVWGEQPAYFSLLEGIKKAIDPHRVLNPKRFVGGI